jgi:DNA-binding transcriptional LysR family regulator
MVRSQARIPDDGRAAAGKRLVPVLEDWTPRSVGFFLYYPSRRQIPAALQVFINVLKDHSR